jgi:hypothetical protein
MPDQDQTGFSRVCPSCGRRVPRNVNACRCGVELPAETSSAAPAAIPEESSGGSGTLIALVVAVLLIGGAGYWLFLRPASVVTQTEAAEEDDVTPEATAATASDTSPIARAWDAAANAKETTPADPEPIAPPAAEPAAPTPLSASTEEMVDRVMPAVVLIETTGGRGSGFYVRHDTLITNVHVVENDRYVTLRRNDGTTVNARVEPAGIDVEPVGTRTAFPRSSAMESASSIVRPQRLMGANGSHHQHNSNREQSRGSRMILLHPGAICAECKDQPI